ncbi:hypothetical protein GCM10011339_13640 [Echinicola rosea]|uniref:Uncharacterized protein n=1 Tax=Echinicola rosea TaxID=1807691 RepID=A0ABQ1UTH3_9BACT|nr:hypothetical protein GCM10011339_13640 [Echinicola rosea]
MIKRPTIIAPVPTAKTLSIELPISKKVGLTKAKKPAIIRSGPSRCGPDIRFRFLKLKLLIGGSAHLGA